MAWECLKVIFNLSRAACDPLKMARDPSRIIFDLSGIIFDLLKMTCDYFEAAFNLSQEAHDF
jgi:hypothetical protein